MVNSGAPPTRNGKLFARTISVEEAWDYPLARSEAAHCLTVARANGGIAAMRELISITEGERRELLSWAAADPNLTSKILAAVIYREQVLVEFEKLVNEQTRPETPA